MADRTQLHVPFTTLLKIALFVLLVFVVIRLWPVILMLTVAVLLAVMLDPLVRWLNGHGVRGGWAIGVVALLLFSVVAAFLFAVIPATVSELRDLGKELPRIVADVQQRYPQARPLVTNLSAEMRKHGGAQMQQWLTRGVVAGRFAVEGLTVLILMLVLAIYLLREGRRVIAWLLAFAHGDHRPKLERTIREVQPIIFAYMRGQAITCCLCGGVAFTTLTLLHVPAALPLAIVAFVADLVPVVGTIVMTVPAVALALVVSPVKALIVLAVYMAYHLVESYWILPRIYGGQMKLSTLTVLVAVTVGGALQGPIGAVLILPFVAAYPVIERIWLRRQLGETVEEHRQLGDSVVEPGNR